MSTNHNLFEEKGEPKQNCAKALNRLTSPLAGHHWWYFPVTAGKGLGCGWAYAHCLTYIVDFFSLFFFFLLFFSIFEQNSKRLKESKKIFAHLKYIILFLFFAASKMKRKHFTITYFGVSTILTQQKRKYNHACMASLVEFTAVLF